MTTESTVREALAAQFDDYTVHRCLRDGDRNAVYEVTVDGRRVACKTTDSQPALLARERAVLGAVRERTDVPVPAVVWSDDGVLLLEWAQGAEYDQGDSFDCRRAQLRAVGRELARLHGATDGWFDGHGTLAPGGGPLTVTEPTDWSERFERFVEEWAAGLRETPDSDVGAAVLETVREHREAFADCSPVLVHGEPAPDHVRFDGRTVSVVVDWELSQAAPGAFDLVWAERDFLRRPTEALVDEDLRAALREGYEAERRLPAGSAFRRAVYRAAFAMRDLQQFWTPDRAEIENREPLRRYVHDCLDAAASNAPVTDPTDSQSSVPDESGRRH